MPSARRRRFSVQNKNENQKTNRSQNETQISYNDEINLLQNIPIYKNKINPSTSKKLSIFEIVAECKSITSTSNPQDSITSDKEVTASSSNINLYTILNATNTLQNKSIRDENEENDKQNVEHIRRDRIPRRDKYLHRVKIRSPKRKASYLNKEIKKRSIGITAQLIEQNFEEKEIIENVLELAVKQVIDVGENTEEEEISRHSLGDICRICHSAEAVSDAGNLISACLCRGTIGRVHVKCLERWLTESGKSRCELCGTKYITRRVHRFGILKAFVMWILSHNCKNMIVDLFGILIMTPIAVVAAGLTGRTFAGLMAQDHYTQWPMASTFVLACMTLVLVEALCLLLTIVSQITRKHIKVCYYCWIVSALTRHALGWWIWYRSHYEVRLQLQENNLY